MVIVSDDVRNVVNRIFLVGIAYKGRISNLYGQIVSAFEKLGGSVVNVNASSVNSAPFAWKRDKVLVLRVGSLMFSYSKVIQHNGKPLVIIHEVMENGRIVTERIDKIKAIINETINQYLKDNLNEAYIGDLYHFTTLSHLYAMLKSNCIYRTVDEYGHRDRRMGDDVNVICLTRSITTAYHKSVNDVRITLDAGLLSSSLRKAKIHPYNYYENGEEYDSKSQEFEERLYGNDIYPLSKYCKSIDIFVGDLNRVDYGFCDDIDYAFEGLYKEDNINPNDRDVNEWFLKHIVNDFPQWANKIHIHTK